MSLDERNTDHEAAPRGPASLVGPSIWLVLTCLVLAVLAVRWTDAPIPAVAGAAVLVVLVGWATRNTVTEAAPRARRRESRRNPWPDSGMKTVVDALDDPCIVVDAAETVRYVNRDATVRYGAVRPGDPLSFRLRIPVLHETVDRVVALNRPEQVEWQEKIPTERWLRAHLSPMRFPPDPRGDDRRPDFVLIRIEDLTESRRVERMRADFVANASHELRTPLAAVSGFIETLQGPARNDAVAREKFLAIMAEQAGRMKRLIDDLLSLSRVEMRAHLRPDTIIDLAPILRQVVDLATPAATAAGVAISVVGGDTPRQILGDRDEMMQIFTNLLENAVKYGGSGGRVEITLASDELRRITVAVRDFGEGIDPVHLPRLTERFYRAHAESSREKRGTGLGLAIVKHIVTRHGGRLTIDSRPGEGSTFTVQMEAPPSARSEKA